MGLSSTTWKYIRRSPYHAIAASSTMFLTLLLTGFFIISTIASEITIRYFESKPQITVFFTDKATKAEADNLSSQLVGTGKTSSIKYISKDEALVLYQKQNKDDPLLLEMVTADILPASLEVSAIDPRSLNDLAAVIRKSENVEEVVYQKDVVDSLIIWTNAIRWIGGILAIVFALNSILVVMTVTGMKLAMRKKEVEILKLVGATSWYIRFPFLFECAIYGLIGAVLSWTVLVTTIIWFRQFLISFLGVVPAVNLLLSKPVDPASLLSYLLLLSVLILLGVILGVLGGLISLGRYLKI